MVCSVVVLGLVGEMMRSDVERRWVDGRGLAAKPPRSVAPGSWGDVGVCRGGFALVASAAKGRKFGASSSSSRSGLGD